MKNKSKFILDDGIIRNCPSNISKMTLMECVKFEGLSDFFMPITPLRESIVNFWSIIAVTIVRLAFLITMPISLPIRSAISCMAVIKRNKILVEKYKRKK